MYKECEQCHKKFITLVKQRKYCSDKCSRAAQRARDRELVKQSWLELAVAAAENKPVKTLSDWSREARECNLDYGQYRAQIEVFGKTYEELKATAASRSTTVHAHASKGSHKVGDSGYGYKLA